MNKTTTASTARAERRAALETYNAALRTFEVARDKFCVALNAFHAGKITDGELLRERLTYEAAQETVTIAENVYLGLPRHLSVRY